MSFLYPRALPVGQSVQRQSRRLTRRNPLKPSSALVSKSLRDNFTDAVLLNSLLCRLIFLRLEYRTISLTILRQLQVSLGIPSPHPPRRVHGPMLPRAPPLPHSPAQALLPTVRLGLLVPPGLHRVRASLASNPDMITM